jgi:tripartite-type tricarboxylate transporter receptor subunit TctC
LKQRQPALRFRRRPQNPGHPRATAIDGKQIKPLALTSLERSAQFPDYKTANESGLPGFEVIVWYGIFAPAGTPEAIINRLNSDINTVLSSADVKERMAALGAEPAGGSAEQFGKRLREEIALWRQVFAKPLGSVR